MLEPKVESEAPEGPEIVDPIKRGGVSTSERGRAAKELIEIEWKVIDRLITMADATSNENKRSFYYQTMTGHIRTLSVLLKLWGEANQKEDLAKLLSEIQKRATSLAKTAKRLKQNGAHTTRNRRRHTA